MDQRQDDLTQRTIGKLEEQGRWMASKIDKMDAKLDKLLSFKWLITGGAMVVSIIVSSVVEFLRR